VFIIDAVKSALTKSDIPTTLVPSLEHVGAKPQRDPNFVIIPRMSKIIIKKP